MIASYLKPQVDSLCSLVFSSISRIFLSDMLRLSLKAETDFFSFSIPGRVLEIGTDDEDNVVPSLGHKLESSRREMHSPSPRRLFNRAEREFFTVPLNLSGWRSKSSKGSSCLFFTLPYTCFSNTESAKRRVLFASFRSFPLAKVRSDW